MRVWVAILVSTLLLSSPALSTDMEIEIDQLLQAVRESGCRFIRNGKAHDSFAAAEHLQMKREKARRYYNSTEQFIARIGSKSSLSGKPYVIDCPESPPIEAGKWFLEKLASIRDTQKTH